MSKKAEIKYLLIVCAVLALSACATCPPDDADAYEGQLKQFHGQIVSDPP